MEADGQRDVSPQRAIIIVGVGRSGTSAITRAVRALGVDLGEDLKPGRGKNPAGFFEDEDLRRITNRVKKALGIRGASVSLIEPEQWERPAIRALRAEAVDTILRRFGKSPVWGFKHGRTLRLLPFWRAVFHTLDLDVRYVMAIRNPLSVARSRARLDPGRGVQEKSDLEWLVTAVPYFRHLRERPLVVVDYDLVMANPTDQLKRMARALDLPVTAAVQERIDAYASEFLRPGLRHSRFTDEDIATDSRVNILTRDAYRWLRRLATDVVDQDATDLWDDWVRIEQRLLAMAPVLRYVDTIENDLRRAKANLMGPLQVVPDVWRKLRGR